MLITLKSSFCIAPGSDIDPYMKEPLHLQLSLAHSSLQEQTVFQFFTYF